MVEQASATGTKRWRSSVMLRRAVPAVAVALMVWAVAEVHLADLISAEIGSVMGRNAASILISADQAERRYQVILSEVGRRVSDFAKPAYGIEVVGVDVRRLSLPEQNREHVFDR